MDGHRFQGPQAGLWERERERRRESLERVMWNMIKSISRQVEAENETFTLAYPLSSSLWNSLLFCVSADSYSREATLPDSLELGENKRNVKILRKKPPSSLLWAKKFSKTSSNYQARERYCSSVSILSGLFASSVSLEEIKPRGTLRNSQKLVKHLGR